MRLYVVNFRWKHAPTNIQCSTIVLSKLFTNFNQFNGTVYKHFVFGSCGIKEMRINNSFWWKIWKDETTAQKREEKKHNRIDFMYLVQQETLRNQAQMHSNKIYYKGFNAVRLCIMQWMNQMGQIYLQTMPSECTIFF